MSWARFLLAAIFSLSASLAAAQSSPGFQTGQVLTAAALNTAFQNKADLPTNAAATLTGAETVDGTQSGSRVLITTANIAALASGSSGVSSWNTRTGAVSLAASDVSAVAASVTGIPISTGVSGLGSGVASFLATPSSANLAAALTNETGSGFAVFATSPSLTTPNIGAATASGLTLSGITGSTQCLHVNTSGVVSGTSTDCGSGGGTPGGSTTQIQYNSSGSFAGDPDLTYTSGSHLHTLGVGGIAGAYGPAVGAGTGQSYITVTPPSAGLNDPFTLSEVSDSNGGGVQSDEIYTLGFNLNGNGRVNTSDPAGGLFIQTLQSTGAFAKVAFQFATSGNTIYYPIEADYNPTSGVVDASMRCDTCFFLSKDELTTYVTISSSEINSSVAFFCGSACNTAGGIFSATYNILGSSSGQVELQSKSASASGTILVPSVNDTMAVLGTAQNYTAQQTLGATPTLTSTGFGTSPSVVGSASAMDITVGSSPSAAVGTITFSITASHGWVCSGADITTKSTTVASLQQTGGTTTTATIENLTDVMGTAAWTASDHLRVMCAPY